MADAIQVPSGIAILAPTPAKAAEILQYKDVIAQRFGKAVVERQRSWTTFIIGPLSRKVSTMDGTENPLDGLLFQEPAIASTRDEVTIKRIAWPKLYKESSDLLGQVRIHVPKSRARKFPTKLKLFGSRTASLFQHVKNATGLIPPGLVCDSPCLKYVVLNHTRSHAPISYDTLAVGTPMNLRVSPVLPDQVAKIEQ